ncbi:MAG: tRNA pseudouridine(55) synthase TruB [Treponema sp.]|nr:tRNA pseudouridine(55) synthase TruB [Treponema sp.]
MAERPNISGIILYDKEPGITSFSSLGKIKKVLGTKKLGHTGTLDSFAQGLLVVCVGSLTRLAGLITAFDKEYEALIVFGEETDTLDPTGQVVKTAPLPTLDALKESLNKFTGKLMQRPPEFSAIKIGGKRASDLTREGKAAVIPERPIEVYQNELLDAQTKDGLVQSARVRFLVSKGTYIRCLARDIALDLNSAAHLKELKRTRVGSFLLKDAANKDTISGQSLAPMTPQIASLCGMKSAFIKEGSEGDFYNGRPLRDRLFCKPLEEGASAVFDTQNNFMGAISKSQGFAKYEYVVPKSGGQK